jgi:hypothetical protein
VFDPESGEKVSSPARPLPTEVRRREERVRLQRAIAVLASVYGPVWRPRRRLLGELQRAPAIAGAVGVLGEAIRGDDPKCVLRATRVLANLVSRTDSQIFSGS